MPQFVAFMRAVNVTGRFIKMAVLADHFRSLGFSQVSTFINSGNVVFNSPADATAPLEDATEASLEPLLGFKSEVFLRGVGRVSAIAQRAAFLASESPSSTEVNVAFLKAPLNAAQQQALRALGTEVDSFAHSEREVYWLCNLKQSESRFSNAVLERKLQLRTTLRRASMLQQLSARFRDAAAG